MTPFLRARGTFTCTLGPFSFVPGGQYSRKEKEIALTIREFAAERNHQIVGKLTRRPDLEYKTLEDGSKVRESSRAYLDDAGNEYYTSDKGICIVTADGGVI